MNSIRYRIQNPWGLHARSSAFVVRVAQSCAAHWEVIASVRENECDAKSIMHLMELGAGYGTEIEFLSLMPDEQWVQFISGLEALFYVTDHEGNKANAYEPVERILKSADGQGQPACSLIRNQLQSRSAHYNCGPIFERIGVPPLNPKSATRVPKKVGQPLNVVDTFISYDSNDFSYAVRIYDALLDKGLQVFLAGASLPRSGTTDFQMAIETALDKASSMIVVATRPTHLEGGWVRAE